MNLRPRRRPTAAKFQILFQERAELMRKKLKVLTFKEVRKRYCLDKMPSLPVVKDRRVGVEIRKAPTPPRTPGSLPANGAAGRPCPVSGDIRPGCSGSFGARGPDLWESSRAQPEGPLSAGSDKPFPRRPAPAQPGHQTVRAAPPGRLGARIPPARPTPAREPLGVTD